jgi:hypothetical protein
MLVFISWSGDRSKYIARTLSDWFENVFHNVRCWMSDEDIAAGKRWGSEVSQALQDARFGVACVTPENREAPWLLFESGALAKSVAGDFLCPYLFEMISTDFVGPLTQFQTCEANRDGTLKLVRSMNAALGDAGLAENKVQPAFEKWWPDLEAALKNTPGLKSSVPKGREPKELQEETLEIVRRLETSMTALSKQRSFANLLVVPGSGAAFPRTLSTSFFPLRGSTLLTSSSLDELLKEAEQEPKEKTPASDKKDKEKK